MLKYKFFKVSGRITELTPRYKFLLLKTHFNYVNAGNNPLDQNLTLFRLFLCEKKANKLFRNWGRLSCHLHINIFFYVMVNCEKYDLHHL